MMTYKLTCASPSQPPLPTTPSPSDTFTLHTPPHTDIWRKAHPFTDTFNGPHYTTTLPLTQLKSIQVTVKSEWKTLYDQAGLLLILPPPSSSPTDETTPNPTNEKEKTKWIKTGLEFYNHNPHISAVACDRWADWSLVPLPPSSSGKGELTIRMHREVVDDQKTSTLWITYYQHPESGGGGEGEWMPIREIAWGFEGAEEEGGKEARVGVYAAKPTAETEDPDGGLRVEFTGLEVERW
ncbi:MAG: hypothetical protein Q9182_003762 [Xanthomendoza sp. 2 TL-2023]